MENRPRKTAKRRVYLSAEDVDRLADAAGEHRALVLALAYTGIRWGEAIALRVRDVEFLRRRLSVHENAVQIGVDHAVGPTKGRKARSVPVPAFVLDELSVQCQGKAPRRSGVRREGRRVPAPAQVHERMVRRVPWKPPGCRPSRRTTFATPARRWPSAPG